MSTAGLVLQLVLELEPVSPGQLAPDALPRLILLARLLAWSPLLGSLSRMVLWDVQQFALPKVRWMRTVSQLGSESLIENQPLVHQQRVAYCAEPQGLAMAR